MILRRVIAHVRKQEWTAIALDFLIVVFGVSFGIQVSNWNESRRELLRGNDYLVRIHNDLQADLESLERRGVFWRQVVGRSPENSNAALSSARPAAGTGRRKGQEKPDGAFLGLAIHQPGPQRPIEAAELRNHCHRNGVQLGTIDALIAQLCIRHELTLLSTDADFLHAARLCPLRNWGAR